MGPVRPYGRLLRRTIAVLVVAFTGLAGVGVASAQASSAPARAFSAPAQASLPIAATQFAYNAGGDSAAGITPTVHSGAVRLWDIGLRWSNVNPAPGQFSFGWFDQVVAVARARQEKPLYVLGMTPGWAAADPHDTTCRFYVAAAATPGSGPGQCSPPKSLASWDDYVRHVVTRYRGRIESYEIWNEANLPQYWKGTPATLALMSQHAIAIIGSVDPAAIVVSASTIFQDNPSVQSWMQAYARSGGYAGTDRVGLHLYPWSSASGPEAMVPLLRTSVAVLAAVGVHQPVWNTEIAFGLIWGTNAYRPGRRPARHQVDRRVADVLRERRGPPGRAGVR